MWEPPPTDIHPKVPGQDQTNNTYALLKSQEELVQRNRDHGIAHMEDIPCIVGGTQRR